MKKRDADRKANEETRGVPDEETAYLLRSEAMRQRLLKAKEGTEGIAWDEVRQKLEFDLP
ncbi:MAG TPA: hypothetical protein VEP28_11135 [Rubrobacter sp.]|nr:hypothetical protein [Rubrobacter sp.]